MYLYTLAACALGANQHFFRWLPCPGAEVPGSRVATPSCNDAPVSTDDYCYLTTTGRRSGRPHRIEIWYASEGEALYLLSGGGRSSDWVRNILNDDGVTVEIDGQEQPARGRVVDDDEEARRARSLVYDKYAPRYSGDLTQWRDRALPVAIDLA